MKLPKTADVELDSAPPPGGQVPARSHSPTQERRQPKGIDVKVLPAARPTIAQQVGHHPPSAKNFRALYCELQGIPRKAFARHIFFQCSKWWVRPFVALQYGLLRGALENDFRLIEEVAEATTYREFMGGLETFTYRNRESGFFREVLRIRMSAKLLMKFGSKLLRHTDRETMNAEQEMYAAVRPGGQPQRVSPRAARRF